MTEKSNLKIIFKPLFFKKLIINKGMTSNSELGSAMYYQTKYYHMK